MKNPAFVRFRTGGRSFIKLRKDIRAYLERRYSAHFRSVCLFYIEHLSEEDVFELLIEVRDIRLKHRSSARLRAISISSFESSVQIGKAC